MSIGLLSLVSVGKENIYLSIQPEITFFKIAYKRYSNFSIETVPQYFKTIPDFGRRVTVNISKNADLLGMCYIYVSLPDIIQSNHSILPLGIKKFSWVKKIGLALIKNVDLEIGGMLIERHYGDWLNIWYELNIKYGKTPSYSKMIGNIDLLTNFNNGKKSYGLNIPLNFWFCQDTGLALPLVAMIHNDIKINVEFNDFNLCFKESPTNYINIVEPYCLYNNGEIIEQNIDGNIIVGEFIYYDNINQNLYYNKLVGDFIIPTTNNSRYVITGLKSKFQTNITPNSKLIVDESYFRFNIPSILDAYLLVNYIYLDNEERTQFMRKPHQYLVPIVQNIQENIFYSTNVGYKIPFINSNKIIFWRVKLLSNDTCNDVFNYSLYPLTTTQEDIIQKCQVILNSISRMDPSNKELFSSLQNYINKFVSSEVGIYMYSFSLNPFDYQPSGALNFSKIDDAYLQLSLNKLINYQNPVSIRAYGLQYNVFKVNKGLGNLIFYL